MATRTKSYATMKTNATFAIATLFPCTELVFSDELKQNTLWRQTVLGCKIIQLMQEVHGFNTDYVYQKQDLSRDVTTEIKMFGANTSVDLFARPMSLRADVLQLANPVGAVFDWDFGFTISHPDYSYRNFYSKPFTRSLWIILYGMAIFSSLLFYLLKKWENQVEGAWECSYGYELLMVLGAYCQHIPPVEARILSRRIAYFVFFIFAYIVYTYYTSNLLSHLVNDSSAELTLQELLDSDIECVVLSSVKAIINNSITRIYGDSKISANYQRLLELRPVSMEEGIRAIKTTKTALLSDYVTLVPYIKEVFSSNEICNLAQVDVVVNLKKYLFVSKTFPYMEIAKISMLRIKEAGIASRIIHLYYDSSLMECTPPPHVQTQFLQIVWPLLLLVGAYAVSVCVLLVEIWHSNRNKVWPFVN